MRIRTGPGRQDWRDMGPAQGRRSAPYAMGGYLVSCSPLPSPVTSGWTALNRIRIPFDKWRLKP